MGKGAKNCLHTKLLGLGQKERPNIICLFYLYNLPSLQLTWPHFKRKDNSYSSHPGFQVRCHVSSQEDPGLLWWSEMSLLSLLPKNHCCETTLPLDINPKCPWKETTSKISYTLRLHGMSWGVKTTCFKAPGVSLGGSGVSIGGVRSLRVVIVIKNPW